MARKRKPKQPEEDLAALVSDMINSPITKPNLSFLKPWPETPRPTDKTMTAGQAIEGLEGVVSPAQGKGWPGDTRGAFDETMRSDLFEQAVAQAKASASSQRESELNDLIDEALDSARNAKN